MVKIKWFSLICLTAVLSACGGGSGDTNSNDSPAPAPTVPTPVTPEPTIYKGVFLDSAVSNLAYSTNTQTGKTSATGEFNYQLDEDIVFSIGDIKLPAVKASAVLTPLDVFKTTDIQNQSVINVIRLLQSLDSDSNPENGIEIAESVHELASNISLDITAADFEQKANGLIASMNTMNMQLVSSAQALEHFQRTIENLHIGTCASTHAKVGYSGDFSTIAHNVSGRATIIDDCTIQVSSFSYDGGGPEVYFYGAIDKEFESENAFIIGSKISGQAYNNNEITLRLPVGKTLDDLNSISVWCVDFKANFGDLTFTP